MKSFFIAVTLALVFFLAIFFGSQNEQLVNISYFVAKGEFRLTVVLASVFLFGFLLSWLFAAYHIVKLKLKVRNLSKRLTLAELKSSEDVEA